MAKRTPLETAKATAVAFYRAEEKKNPSGYPYSPADATRAASKASGIPFSRLVPVVAAVYYAENGSRSPIRFRAAKPSEKAIASAVAKRRNAGGRLGRWEVVAASLSAGLGRPVSVAAVRAFAKIGGVSETASYTGRGTRAGAVATRTSETAEVVA